MDDGRLSDLREDVRAAMHLEKKVYFFRRAGRPLPTQKRKEDQKKPTRVDVQPEDREGTGEAPPPQPRSGRGEPRIIFAAGGLLRALCGAIRPAVLLRCGQAAILLPA